MARFFTKYANQLKRITLFSMMVIPFFLYYAAANDWTALIYVLLAGMGLSMLLAIKVG